MPTKDFILSQEILKELIHYNPDTGVFIWKYRDRKWFDSDRHFNRWNTQFANKRAGCVVNGAKNSNYIQIYVLSKSYKGHQLAWLYVTGELTNVFHLDGDGTDIRWSNLQKDTPIISNITGKRVNFSQEFLKSILEYYPESGQFRWKVRNENTFINGMTRSTIKHFNNVFAGKIAGSTDSKDYCHIKINTHLYAAHRLAWLHMTGEWPKMHIDHKDGNPFNNRWGNLRLATNSQNVCNGKTRSDNTSGFKGVTFSKPHNKYRADICLQGKKKHLGLFYKAEDAAKAYQEAADKIHGEFARY